MYSILKKLRPFFLLHVSVQSNENQTMAMLHNSVVAWPITINENYENECH